MNWRIIWNIAVKDWKEIRQNGLAWKPALIVPFFFVIVPAVFGVIVLPRPSARALQSASRDIEPMLAMTCRLRWREQLAGLNPDQMLMVLMLGFLFSPMFLIIPLLVSSIIGADSIVGEKERKTLEALLYTPASDRELYLAKLLSAILPAVALSWISFVAYALVVNLAGASVMGRIWFPLPHWIPLILMVAPAVATLGMAGSCMVSSRVSTFRRAQQTSGLPCCLSSCWWSGRRSA